MHWPAHRCRHTISPALPRAVPPPLPFQGLYHTERRRACWGCDRATLVSTGPTGTAAATTASAARRHRLGDPALAQGGKDRNRPRRSGMTGGTLGHLVGGTNRAELIKGRIAASTIVFVDRHSRPPCRCTGMVRSAEQRGNLDSMSGEATARMVDFQAFIRAGGRIFGGPAGWTGDADPGKANADGWFRGGWPSVRAHLPPILPH
jgi:hypothetical protein